MRFELSWTALAAASTRKCERGREFDWAIYQPFEISKMMLIYFVYFTVGAFFGRSVLCANAGNKSCCGIRNPPTSRHISKVASYFACARLGIEMCMAIILERDMLLGIVYIVR